MATPNPTHAVVEYANAQEQGSFCDANSGYEYNNVSAFQESTLPVESTHIDREGSEEAEDLDQRHNVWYASTDSHDQYYPAKHGPGH
jgi:hypothetical protein